MKKFSVLALSLLSIGLAHAATSNADEMTNDPATFELYAGPKPIAGTYCNEGEVFLTVNSAREIAIHKEIIGYSNWSFRLAPTFVRRLDYDAATKTYKAPGSMNFNCGSQAVALPVRFEGDFAGDVVYVSIFTPSSLDKSGCTPATNSPDAWYSWDYKLTRATMNAQHQPVCKK